MFKILLLLLVPVMAFGQADEVALPPGPPLFPEIRDYIVAQARGITARAEAEIGDFAAWQRVREERREQLRDMLGLLPWPQRTPLNVRITGKLERPEYTIEKIAFESVPKFYVTANLYIPKGRKGKVPAIVYVCGHAWHPQGSKVPYQEHAILYAKAGYAVFLLDPILFAEAFSIHHGVHSLGMYEWYARGYTPGGIETWNAMRAIDYLLTRGEVDGERIGITGRSGGAAISWFTAAVDTRVRAAMPVMGIGTYAVYAEQDTSRRHCDCMFPINVHRLDLMHQAALIAPRALTMAHGTKDSGFPVPGYKQVERAMMSLYKAYGRPEAFHSIEVETAHRDSDFLREQAIHFFDRSLKEIPERKPDMSRAKEEGPALAVFPQGPPADARNAFIHETFTSRPVVGAELSRALRTQVFPWLNTLTAPRILSSTAGTDGYPFREIRFSPEEGVTVRGVLRESPFGTGEPRVVLYVASEGDTETSTYRMLRRIYSRRKFLWFVVYPRGVDRVQWDEFHYRNTMVNAMHVGDTVDSMRLRDVLQAAAVLKAETGRPPDLVLGRSAAGILGLYAAILNPEIGGVALMEPTVSHAQRPIFLNILRYTELPGAAKLLAPRPLHFVGRIPPEFSAFSNARSTMNLAGLIEDLDKGTLPPHNR